MVDVKKALPKQNDQQGGGGGRGGPGGRAGGNRGNMGGGNYGNQNGGGNWVRTYWSPSIRFEAYYWLIGIAEQRWQQLGQQPRG